MKRALTTLALGLLLCVGTAQADTISFVGPVGNYNTSTVTFVGLITAQGFYFTGGVWTTTDANLFGRNQTNDHGLGLCNVQENASGACGTGSGGGDINELDNAGWAELIRLTLPAGYQWVSVQLSSLDNNGSTDPNAWERGSLWADTDGLPGASGAIGNNLICNFASSGSFTCVMAGGTGAEPIYSIPGQFANSPYLFFEPRDWRPGGTNTNNDFLVMAVTITQVPEPATLALVGTGLSGLGLLSRKRRKA